MTLGVKVLKGVILFVVIVFVIGYCYTAYKDSRTKNKKNNDKKIFAKLNPKTMAIVTYSLSAVIAFVLCVTSSVFLALDINQYLTKINTDFQKENATFVRYEEVTIDYYTHYKLHYEYVSSDGTIYSGVYPANIVNFDYAKNKIGEKLPIYVDHEHKEHLLEKKFDYNESYIFAPAAVLFLSFLIYCLAKLFTICKRYEKVPEDQLDYVEMVASKKPINSFLLYFLVLIVSTSALVFCSTKLIEFNNEYKINSGTEFVKEEATIVYYERQVDGDLVVYPVYYEFVSEEKLYTGCYLSRITDEDKARSLIGEKVQIFVNHNLEIFTTKLNHKPDQMNFVWIGEVACGALMLFALIKICIYCCKYFKFKSKYKDIIKRYNISKYKYIDSDWYLKS